MKTGAQELSASQIRRHTDGALLNCHSTDQLKKLEGFIGQDRAVRAMDFGLSMTSKGYNVFLVGLPGCGRTTYARQSVTERAATMAAPQDWVYVYNFTDPANPIALSLPAGQGRELEQAFVKLMDELKSAISSAFEKSAYEDAKTQEISAFQERVSDLMNQVKEEAEKQGFLMKRTPQGFVNIPLKEVINEQGETEKAELQADEYEALPEEEKKRLKGLSDSITSSTLNALRQIREQERALKAKVSGMEAEICRSAVAPYIEELRERFCRSDKFRSWLDSMVDHVVSNFGFFLAAARDENAEVDLTPYGINVLISNDPQKGAPAVWETNPTFYNLAGKMEYESRQGYYFTDFSRIVPGALHRANGGFLMLDAEELLRNYMSYDLLKRVLRSGSLTVENLGDQYGVMPVASPRPEAIPIDVKVVLVGSYYIYYLLQQYDPEFQKLFKLVAEFDYEMARTPEAELEMARFVKTVAEKENCLPFQVSAITEIIDWSARLAGHQERLSLQFNRLQEIIVEASAWASFENADAVEMKHVARAVDEKRHRSSMTEEKIRQDFADDTVRIDTEGSQIGQINGLAVVSFADVSFGHPMRITANTFMGQEGVVNIERETNMAGPIHNKGLLTLSSYLGRIYAQDMPLTLSARLAFEQNYGGIDGDSASSAELYCLLSSLAEVPIRQNIAVTGSVDQFGNIQPIGGVNEKIEGFFSYCLEKGLTGDQGVMIPWQNVRHLMLSREVEEAVIGGRFHIWSVKTIDEGIELLMGMSAGKRNSRGGYPRNSVHGRVMAKLKGWIKKSLSLSSGKKASSSASKGQRKKSSSPEKSR